MTDFRIRWSDGTFWLVEVILNLVPLDSRLLHVFRLDFCPTVFILGLACCTVMTILGLACCTVMTVPGLAFCTAITCFRQNLPVTVTSLEFPWLVLIDERYYLIAGPLKEHYSNHQNCHYNKLRASFVCYHCLECVRGYTSNSQTLVLPFASMCRNCCFNSILVI